MQTVIKEWMLKYLEFFFFYYYFFYRGINLVENHGITLVLVLTTKFLVS